MSVEELDALLTDLEHSMNNQSGDGVVGVAPNHQQWQQRPAAAAQRQPAPPARAPYHKFNHGGGTATGSPAAAAAALAPPPPAAEEESESRSSSSTRFSKGVEETPGRRFVSSVQRPPEQGYKGHLRSEQEDVMASPTALAASNGAHSPAVKQNINELDSLLQDLSNARFSEHHETSSKRVEEVQQHSTSSFSSSSEVTKKSKSVQKEESRMVMTTSSSSSQDKVVKTSATSAPFNNKGSLLNNNNNSIKSNGMAAAAAENFSSSINRTKQHQQPLFNRQFSAESSQQRNMSSSSTAVGFPIASSATEELDELMTSLNTFKIKEGPATEEPVATILDDMLGNLQEDMDKQGIRATQKGVCFECEKPIVGQVITALGKTFHPEHFTCAHCNQELGLKNFFERDGKPYCELDYHTLFSPRCGACDGPILDKCVSALDRTWHPEHFVCHQCECDFGDEGYHEMEDNAYCKDCYYAAFAPKCGGCHTPITENYISSLDRTWHPSCFVCRQCKQPFVGGNFFEHEGFPYCEFHYNELRGSPCAACEKPISGRCITAMFRKFHPEHFVCSFCLKQLNKGTFKEKSDKPYCHACYDRLFG